MSCADGALHSVHHGRLAPWTAHLTGREHMKTTRAKNFLSALCRADHQLKGPYILALFLFFGQTFRKKRPS